MDIDPYEANAQWYGALTADSTASTSAAIRTLLEQIADGTAIDVGAGVGSQLSALRELGAARIFAVEPSRAMRAGLMATVGSNPDLLARTTVVAEPVPAAFTALPSQWNAVVMLNAIGHLTDETRAHLWETLRERLVPRGRFVVSLQPPETVTAIPWTDFGTVAIGEDQLSTRGRADPIDQHRVEWRMEWTLRNRHGRILDQRTGVHAWRVLGRSELCEEATEYGFTPLDAMGESAYVGFVRRE